MRNRVARSAWLATAALVLGLLFIGGVVAAHAAPGKIVVNSDEWTLSDESETFLGHPFEPSTRNYALNIASWFTGGQPGNFLVYSSNFGLTGGKLQAAVTGAGHSWTVDTSLPFTLATLQQFDAVFLALNPAVDNQVLIDYVNGGGNVYVEGGTGVVGAADEAASWNPFLNAFGLKFEPIYNDPSGSFCFTPFAISSNHPVLSGVSSLAFCNGNSVSRLSSTDPKTAILASFDFGQGPEGLIGVFDGVISFAAFTPKVEIENGEFEVKAPFTLGAGSDGIAPLTEDVTLQIGAFSTTIPAGAFKFQPAKFNKKGKQVKPPQFKFEGDIDGVALEAKITDLGGGKFEFKAEGEGATNLPGANPVTVKLTIGDDRGADSVTAEFE